MQNLRCEHPLTLTWTISHTSNLLAWENRNIQRMPLKYTRLDIAFLKSIESFHFAKAVGKILDRVFAEISWTFATLETFWILLPWFEVSTLSARCLGITAGWLWHSLQNLNTLFRSFPGCSLPGDRLTNVSHQRKSWFDTILSPFVQSDWRPFVQWVIGFSNSCSLGVLPSGHERALHKRSTNSRSSQINSWRYQNRILPEIQRYLS